MATYTPQWLLLLYITSHHSFSDALNSTPVHNTPYIAITVSPSTIYNDMTSEMTLNCSVSSTPDLNVIDVTLSKADNDHILNELAGYTIASPASGLDVKDSLGAANVTSYVSGDLMSIAYTWHLPKDEVQGEYTCAVVGLGKSGQPLSYDDTVVVTKEEPSFAMLISQMQQMESAQKNLSRDYQTYKTNTDTILVKHEADMMTMKATLDVMQTFVITEATSYNGHDYFLSSPSHQNVNNEQHMCAVYGGYLVELDDQQEFDFVYGFINKVLGTSHLDHTWILLGATDEGHKGTWMFLHSGKPMTYFKWAPREPSRRPGESCLVLHSDNLLMHDDACAHGDLRRFLCEIPM